jgi:hypothetical protein
VSLLPASASAEKIIASVDNWQLYTDGRAGGFFSWVYGDGLPRPTYTIDPATGLAVEQHNISGGGFNSVLQQGIVTDPTMAPPGSMMPNQGTINVQRVRSGFIGNVFGFGVRGPITPYTTLTAYIQMWAFIESAGRQKNQPNYMDVRQGYTKIEGPWGSLLAGRTRALFSRGATDIDAMYAHRWGVGFPGSIDSNGPTLGQIGFGVLGSGFAGGVIYGTPNIYGFQLNVGVFDPIQLQGNGGWNRTKYARPEFEATYQLEWRNGKLVLFGNGAYQNVYKNGYCPTTPDPMNPTAPVLPCSATAKGLGAGGRLEVGPFHLGIAVDRGQGLGLNYALEVSDAAQDLQGNMRTFDAGYVQTQLILGKIELAAGVGIARVFRTDFDKSHELLDPTTGMAGFSIIKYQLGENASIVYDFTPALHFDLDFFRAQATWYLGEQQVLYVGNAGMIFNW